VEHERGTGNLPGHSEWRFRVRPRLATARGGAGSPVCRALGPRGRYELPHLEQKDQGETLMLTEGAGRTGRPCRVDGVDGGRWRTAEVAEEVAEGCAGPADPLGRSVRAL